MANTLDQLRESLPAYAKDLKLNLSSVLQQQELTPQQTWGTAIASAYSVGNVVLFEAVLEDARAKVSTEVVEAAKAAAAIMGMNNVYYRFTHLVADDKYSEIPARLRMNIMRTHGVDPLDFELWSLAVSAINGCGKCVVAHERTLREKGIGLETVAAAIRIASVLNAVGAVFALEPIAVPA
jgi:alkyl hydroperoxide reductase subunit D